MNERATAVRRRPPQIGDGVTRDSGTNDALARRLPQLARTREKLDLQHRSGLRSLQAPRHPGWRDSAGLIDLRNTARLIVPQQLPRHELPGLDIARCALRKL